MKEAWHFVDHRPGMRTRNPLQGEFFASEAIEGPAEALVREGIQNALDARQRRDDGTPVGLARVRIFLSGRAAAIPSERMAFYTDGLWPHLHAPRNGLKEPPQETEPCEFLTFEDFGTTGLTGNTEQWDPLPDQKNAFYYFFRAEGITDKTEGRGGSWGVGKYVFPRSSRANAILALTVRSDDGRQLVMGSITLKPRRVGDTPFTPDGWFGLHAGAEEPIAPSDSRELADRLTRDFQLARRGEPGLSIVVPWLDREFTFVSILDAVVRGWFLAILGNRLEVELATPDQEITLNATTLPSHLHRCSEQCREDMEPMLAMAKAYVNELSSGRKPVQLDPPDSESHPEWSSQMLPEEVRTGLNRELDAGHPVIVRVPLAVRFRDKRRATSHFDLVLQKDEDAGAPRVTFIRNDILIPEVRHARPRGVRALLVADHADLANLLRDAEHPAHTHWSKDTSNFKQKYQWGPSYLSFVQNSADKLVTLLRAGETDEAPRLLVDLFSIPHPPEDDEDSQRARRRKKKSSRPSPGPGPIRRRPLACRVSEVAGGFTISRGEDGAPTPKKIRVRVAYDCEGTNPFNAWHKADFRLDDGIITIEDSRGLSVKSADGNVMLLDVSDPDFYIRVKGFDTNRDLIVKVDAESEHAGSDTPEETEVASD
jgi:hypothetical protein